MKKDKRIKRSDSGSEPGMTNNMEKVERKEWEKTETETSKAYEGFRVYRDMGPGRSLSQVADELGKSLRLLKKWSSQHSWVKRAEAYDEHMERHSQQVVERKLEDLNQAHLDMAKSARESVMVPLNALLKRIEKVNEDGNFSSEDFENIPVEKLINIARPYVKLALDVIKLERLLYGLPTQTIKTEGTIGHEVSHDIRVVNEFIESLPEEELLRIVRDSKKQSTQVNGSVEQVPLGPGEG